MESDGIWEVRDADQTYVRSVLAQGPGRVSTGNAPKCIFFSIDAIADHKKTLWITTMQIYHTVL